MPRVFFQTQLRDLTGDIAVADVSGATLREVIRALDQRFPGLADRIVCQEQIAAGLAVSIDGVVTSRGLLTKVQSDSEIHILPAIGGG